MERLLFLSHSGIDTEAAQGLKARILAAPAAREHGLRVWFDKDDLRAGEPWQSQLENAIGESHAFAVYVGTKGVVNWVEVEVRLALNRAIAEPGYRFIPILAGTAPGPEALPGFARQFQGVFDVEARPEQFDHLMRAVLGGAEAGQLHLETEPFFGLRAIDESRSHLFFGREEETAALAALVHRAPLVVVTGDSGSGKSSLVHAGLVPRFRGGALAVLDGARPENTAWHVVTTRPRSQPFRQLGDAVDEAAKGLGLTLAERGTLADWAASGDIDKVRRALRCDLPPERVQVLLVVDQFEELLTITAPELRAPFIDLLLDLSDPSDGRHRVVLTMRHDYANLCNAHERLKARLEADDRRARFALGRMSDEGLRRIVSEPLRLAAIEAADREALAREVLRDVGERPGDLALVQMALTETWRARSRHDGDLLRAYAEVGRVEGALAKAAERVRAEVLDTGERELLDPILLRLVRLGDTGGSTRRVAARREFDDERWTLVQKLASEDGRRLLLLRGSTEQPTVEIAHEALVTAWPYFQNLLQQTADDKRILDQLISRAQAWAAQEDQGERDKRHATGADLELFAGLLDRRAAWLAVDEHGFVGASMSADNRRRRRDLLKTRGLQGVAAGLLIAFGIAGWMWWRAEVAEAIAVEERREAVAARDATAVERDRATAAAKAARASEAEANEAARIARANESRALAALSEVAFHRRHYVDAVKLALAAWPRASDGDRPKLRAAMKALGQAQRLQRQTILRHDDDAGVRGAAFNRDETRILTWSVDGTARLWDAATGEPVMAPLRHEQGGGGPGAGYSSEAARLLSWYDAALRGATFSPDETHLLTWSEDGTARLWDAVTGNEVIAPLRHEQAVGGAAFNHNGTRILTWSSDAAHLWDATNGKEVMAALRHDREVLGAAFSRDGTRILTMVGDKTARLWDAATGKEVMTALRHDAEVLGAAFSRDGTRILTWSRDDTARLWNTATGEAIGLEMRHQGSLAGVRGATFNGDASRVLTWSGDGTARLFDARTGDPLGLVMRHDDAVMGASFNRDDARILTWSWDSTARLWDAVTGEALLEPLKHNGPLFGAAFSPDEARILTWSKDGTARLWDSVAGEPIGHEMRHEQQEAILGAAFSADGTRILSWSMTENSLRGSVRLWDSATGRQAMPSLHHADRVVGARFIRDESRILTWSRDHTARLWDAAAGQEILPALRHNNAVNGAVLNGDESRILTWSDDGTVRVWDAATGDETLLVRHHDAVKVAGAAFDHDEARILTWSYWPDSTARLWEASTGEPLLPLLDQEVEGAAFNRDGNILTWSRDGTVRLWDAVAGQPSLQLLHEGGVSGARFNRGETRILTWSRFANGTARLWDATTGQEIGAPLQHDEDQGVYGARFNRDATLVLSWSGSTMGLPGTARLWNAATGEQVAKAMRHDGTIFGARFNRDENRILTWSEDGTARLWDIATGEEVVKPLRHEGPVYGAAFNGDENRILTWGRGVRLWDAATGEELVAVHGEAEVYGAVFNRDESRILTWSADGSARLWDIARLPRGHLIDVACGMLANHDTSELALRYGIAIVEPICGPDAPAPVWTELED